jgi:hypothetical protein
MPIPMQYAGNSGAIFMMAGMGFFLKGPERVLAGCFGRAVVKEANST